jgi:hypothetical protein
MSPRFVLLAGFLIGSANFISIAAADEPKPYAGLCTATLDPHFADELWTKVGAQKCLTCHKTGGDAEDSKFLLRDPMRVSGDERAAALLHNQRAFTEIAKVKEGADYRVLLKVTGGLDHGGEDVLPKDST